MKLFPREDEFNADALAAGKATGVPAYLLKGFAALESAFNPKAYRYEEHIKDASYGLAQVLVGTARGFGFSGTPEKLFEPTVSLYYGGRFIRALATKYPKLTDLVSAYNCGFPRPIARTTPLIAGIYKYPIEYRERAPQGWVYANEPYVRRTTAYIAYYQARETDQMERAEKIVEHLKRKEVSIVYETYGKMIVPLWDKPCMTIPGLEEKKK